MKDAPKWNLRLAEPNDISFIYATWLNSYRTGSGLGLASGKQAYYLTYNCVIDNILSREGTKTLVAVDPAENSVIYGYLVASSTAIHYAFVKEAFQRLGIARSLYEKLFGLYSALWPDSTPFITHKTRALVPILKKYPLTYNPTLIFQEA